MRKFYTIFFSTLVMVALICSSANAAERSTRSLDNVIIKPLNTVLPKAKTSNLITGKHVKKRADESAEYSIFGEYYALYYYLDDDDWLTYITPLEVVEGESGEVTIKDFYLHGIDVVGTYDTTEGTISIPKQVIYKTNGYSLCLQLYQTDNSQVVLSDDDFVFFFDDMDGSLSNYDFWGITVYNEGEEFDSSKCLGFNDYCMMMISVPTNGKTYLTWNDGEDDSDTVEEYANVICELDGSTLSVDNFNGNGTIVKFTIDSIAKTATAENQTVNTLQDSADNVYFVYMCDTNGNKKVIGDIAGDNNNEVVIGEWASYFEGELVTKYYSTRLITPFNLLGDANIKNVSADESNTPTEYYNLQGMKVQNPANGIFIRKQGTTIEKVLIN